MQDSTAHPSRVLFLDMDGVVLHGQALRQARNNRYIPPEKIALVREVCTRAQCVVVVSSTWRYSDDTADLLRFHGIPLHPDWRTDWRNDYQGSIIVGQRRGLEIHRWLAKHPGTVFAIVDDDSDMLPEQLPYFVQTKFDDGIELHHAERIIALLQRDRDGAKPIAQPIDGQG
jgi:hypothetical protein